MTCIGPHLDTPPDADTGYARGLCRKHYYEAQRDGELEQYPTMPKELRAEGFRRPSTLTERFLAKFDRCDDDECWLWTGTLLSTGYGQINDRGTRYLAHRLAYEHFVGPIPTGLTLDHLCRVPRCVNPRHLEPVTAVENVMRAPGSVGAVNKAKTCCPRCGGPYTQTARDRFCRPCWNDRQRARRIARRASA